MSSIGFDDQVPSLPDGGGAVFMPVGVVERPAAQEGLHRLARLGTGTGEKIGPPVGTIFGLIAFKLDFHPGKLLEKIGFPRVVALKFGLLNQHIKVHD